MLEFIILSLSILFVIFFIFKRYNDISNFTKRTKKFDPNLYRE